MSEQVSKSQFKAKALEYFRQIEASGQSVIVTDHGEPKLEVRPFRQTKLNPLAALKDSVLHYDRPTEPVGEGDWEALK